MIELLVFKIEKFKYIVIYQLCTKEGIEYGKKIKSTSYFWSKTYKD